MNRRVFLAGSTVAFFLEADAIASASSQPNSEIDFWRSFIETLDSIRNAVDVWSDEITKVKISRFLNYVQSPVSDLLAEKKRIAAALDSSTCNGDRIAIVADKASQRIPNLVQRLEASMRTLAGAVKPEKIRADSFVLVDLISDLSYAKVWVADLYNYCRLTPVQKAALREEINVSIALATEARSQLIGLLDAID
ncbi:MAG: hypothetical protein AAFR88_03535 [Pseudomonadota bacterium]